MTEPGSDPTVEALHALAREAGVEPVYEAGGRRRTAPPEALVAVLRELGVAVESPEDAAEARRGLRARRRTRLLEPVTVAWEGGPPRLRLTLPAGSSGPREVEVRVRREDGSTAEHRVEARMPVRTSPEAREVEFDLPADLPRGYHDVEVAVAGTRARTRLVVAPRRAWGSDEPARDWSLFLPLHALRSGDEAHPDRGVGDLGGLARFARWARSRGASAVSTLPLYAAFLGPDGFDPSPYAPVSRLFWNELHLDLESLPGLEHAPAARRLLESGSMERAWARLRAEPRVDHREAAALKRRIGEAVVEEAVGMDGSGPVGPAFREAVADDPELMAYARFRARGEVRGVPWPRWEEPARSGSLPVPEEGSEEARRALYHAWAQWAFRMQLRDGISGDAADLYLDLPLGSHPWGFDVWSTGEVFARGMSGGAPPDAFFQGGQDWGFPPLHPARSRATGHAYWARCVRHLMEVSRIVRLDHVMSLHRLFWVPEGGSPADGVYVEYPAEELWAILCLESVRTRCRVVGEDLGTVPDRVPESMERHGVRRMWVLPFSLDPAPDGEDDAPPVFRPPSPQAVASLSTHDLPPFAAFWQGTDIDDRVARGHLDPDDAEGERRGRARWREAFRIVARDAGVDPPPPDGPDGEPCPPEEALEPALRLLARSGAAHLLVSVEDLLLQEEPQNRPGTAGDHNWTLRASRSLERIAESPRIRGILERLHRERAGARRADPPRSDVREPHPDIPDSHG